MADTSPTLHLVCGKIASGKSTLALELALCPRTILINEDTWLSRLYPGEINSIEDYVRCSARLRSIMEDHIQLLLQEGLSIVLDFPANTLDIRQWMLAISQRAKVRNCLHYLDATNETCKERLHKRNASGSHEFTPSDEQFEQITRHFVAPTEGEGLKIKLYKH